MEKQVYNILFGTESDSKMKMNEPFCLMRADVDLGKKDFSIWKLSCEHQHTHAHDYYQLWYILRGKCQHKIDNHKFVLNCGDLIFIPPFSYHSMSEGSNDLIVIGVDFTEHFFSATEADKNLMLHCVKPICFRQSEEQYVFLADNNIENLILEMFSEFVLKNLFYDIIIRSNLSKLLVLMERMANNTNISAHMVGRGVTECLKYIHSRFNEKITIHDLCKVSNLSETLLSGCFKKATGKTIVEYINSLKVDKAKQLLSETDMRITDISYELGFNDGAYFNRVFKKYAGITPLAYRTRRYKQT